ncbi:MAG: hypothetical protein IKO65_06195 [Victivallales bacterium]|nr:hypothetical protein [Victivallales bacterium]
MPVFSFMSLTPEEKPDVVIDRADVAAMPKFSTSTLWLLHWRENDHIVVLNPWDFHQSQLF